MNRTFEFRQGLAHAANMFEGTLIDATGALVIVSNLEAALHTYPPQYAQGVAYAVARVKAAVEQEKRI